jgi:hypothetical protein
MSIKEALEGRLEAGMLELMPKEFQSGATAPSPTSADTVVHSLPSAKQ